MSKSSSDWFIQSKFQEWNISIQRWTFFKVVYWLIYKNLFWGFLCTDFVQCGCGTPSLPVPVGLRLDVSGGFPVVRDVDRGVRGWEESQEVVLPVWLWHSLGYCCCDSRSEAIRIWNRQSVSQDVWYWNMNKMSNIIWIKENKMYFKEILVVCVHKNVLLNNQLWLRTTRNMWS